MLERKGAGEDSHLWHDAVVGSNNQDDNVGDLRSASPHCRKRSVSWGV